MIKKYNSVIVSFIFALSAGCANAQNGPSQEEISTTAIRGTLNGQAKGDVIFTQAAKGDGVKIIVNVSDVEPGFHGVHLHENPVCEGDFSSAGGHYNPTQNVHGSPEERKHHVGDLGNFKADKDGNIAVERTFGHLSLNPESANYVGNRSLVIHAKADDYSSQPSGASGSRIGCAVLQNTAE